jgi:hypothetical protein
LIYRKDGSKSIIYRPTEISISPEDLLGIVGEIFRFIEELIMISNEKFMKLILLIIELLKRREL